MNVVIEKSKLSGALNAACSVPSKRTTLPILASVLFEIDDGEMRVTSTDLDVTVVVSCKVLTKETGKLCVNAHKLPAIISELEEEEVKIAIKDKKMTIESGNSFFQLHGEDAEEFPKMHGMPGGKWVKFLDQGDFRTTIQRVSYASSVDDSRFVLVGVLFKIKENEIEMVATDGRRLAITNTSQVEIPSEGCQGEFILPTRAVNLIYKLLSKPSDDFIRVYYNETSANFEMTTNDFTYIVQTKTVDGKFPNYEQVIPKNSDTNIEIDRHLLMHAIRRVALMTDVKRENITMSFSKNKLELKASSEGMGEAKEIVPIEYDGDKLKKTFNPFYILDPLKYNRSRELFFETTKEDSNAPGVINFENESYSVVMPLRSSSEPM